jgi:hypothetical protein
VLGGQIVLPELHYSLENDTNLLIRNFISDMDAAD